MSGWHCCMGKNTSHNEHNNTDHEQMRMQRVQKRLTTLLRHTDGLSPTTCAKHESFGEESSGLEWNVPVVLVC